MLSIGIMKQRGESNSRLLISGSEVRPLHGPPFLPVSNGRRDTVLLRLFRTFHALSISVILGPFRLDPHRIALYWSNTIAANVAELVDALDLGSSGETRGSSSLPIRTTIPGFSPQSCKFLACPR